MGDHGARRIGAPRGYDFRELPAAGPARVFQTFWRPTFEHWPAIHPDCSRTYFNVRVCSGMDDLQMTSRVCNVGLFGEGHRRGVKIGN